MPDPIFNSAALRRTADAMPADTTAVPPRQAPGIGLGPYAALIGGNAADTLSTMSALGSGRGREANGLLPQSGAGIAGVKAAMTIPEILMMRYLASHGHPTAAKVLGYGMGGVGAAIAAHNSTVGR